jgi:plastocyanin domain-containing protein
VALRGSFYTLQNIWLAATMDPSELAAGARAARIVDGMQSVQIDVRSNGYSASASTLKAGIPVRLSLVTNKTQGCALAFTIPEFNISRTLPATGVDVVEFTPTKSGRLAYTCGMGMYTGSFTVIL